MPKVKHIVLLKFKDGTNEEQISQFFADVLDLSETVPGVEDYVAGTNNSPESLNQGLTHAFIMTFTDAAARDAYLAHAEHEKFKTMALTVVEATTVVDFEV
jgi:hypothetical protein